MSTIIMTNEPVRSLESCSPQLKTKLESIHLKLEQKLRAKLMKLKKKSRNEKIKELQRTIERILRMPTNVPLYEMQAYELFVGRFINDMRSELALSYCTSPGKHLDKLNHLCLLIDEANTSCKIRKVCEYFKNVLKR